MLRLAPIEQPEDQAQTEDGLARSGLTEHDQALRRHFSKNCGDILELAGKIDGVVPFRHTMNGLPVIGDGAPRVHPPDPQRPWILQPAELLLGFHLQCHGGDQLLDRFVQQLLPAVMATILPSGYRPDRSHRCANHRAERREDVLVNSGKPDEPSGQYGTT